MPDLFMTNLPTIREEIFKSTNPQRLIIKTRTKPNLDTQTYRDEAYQTINEIFPDWHLDSRILFLAIEVWGHRIFTAVDINNHEYDFNTAHKSKAVLPVFVLARNKRRGVGTTGSWNFMRWAREDIHVAEELARLHGANGFDVGTPFMGNHNERVVYSNPRWLYEPREE